MNSRIFRIAVLLVLTAISSEAAEIYTLEDAYRSALNRNEVVKISEENLVQSRSRVDQALSYLYPRISGQATYDRYNEVLPPGNGGFIFQPLTRFQAALVLQQPLYTGGRTFAALRTARDLQESSSLDLNSTRQDIMLNVATAYYGAIKARKMVEKSRDSVRRMERHKQVTEREATTRRTRANISNLLRARTLVSQAYIMLTRDENSLKIARQKLGFLARLPESAVLAEPSQENLPAESLEQLTQIALGNRDDYAASKLNEKIAEENITIVRGKHYPQLYAEAAYLSTDAHPETATEGNTYYGGLRLQIPIFEGGLMKAEMVEALSKQRQSALSRQHLRYSIESEVYESYVNYQTITSVLEAAEKQYQDAESNFKAVQSLFEQGLAASLALIDAQQALFLAERELVNATYDRQLAILRLKRRIGSLGKQIQHEIHNEDL